MNADGNPSERGGAATWGDASAPEQEPPRGVPRWLLALLGVLLIGFAMLLAIPFFAPLQPREPPVDPLGFISPPDRSQDAPQRQFSAEAHRQVAQFGSFVGVEACRECHAERVREYETTHHFASSCVATLDTVRGPVNEGAQVATPNPQLTFEIAANPTGKIEQTAIVASEGKQYRYSKTFDIVIGSGLHAQTFLSWEGSRLYQLPLTYSAELEQWVKSPGYPAGLAIYGRAASSGCLRCHATFMKELPDAWNSYDPRASILGISCERCHGRGESHIAYRRQGGKALTSDPIVRPASLTRERQLEVCGQCHAGVGKFRQPPFGYQPGRPLTDFIEQQALEDQQFGVHSTNQLARLRLSKCYGGEGGKMTCTTCHNPHRPEPSLQAAAQKCLTCHQLADCGKHDRWGQRIATKCIDCHMPTAFDLEADLASADAITFPRMRDHFIAPRPELSSKVEADWASPQKRETLD